MNLKMQGRILAVDPGDRRIGLALSDPSRTVVTPLPALNHASRQQDAEKIVQTAESHQVAEILIGVPYGLEADITPQARKSLRLADSIREISTIQVSTWDETGSTRIASGIKSSHDLDSLAAAVILQDYIDEQSG
jgi:putative Holliday junction resolvase